MRLSTLRQKRLQFLVFSLVYALCSVLQPAFAQAYSGSPPGTLVTSSAASQIGYQMGGPGSVITTVQTKLQESVSVLDFGADPSGVNDSSAAFQAANLYATTYNKAIYVPSSTAGYKLTHSVKLTAVAIRGDTSNSQGGGTVINWRPLSPTDLLPAFNITGYQTQVSNLSVVGPTNYSVSTLVSAGVVTPSALPSYSAFSSGVAAFSVTGSGEAIFTNVNTLNVKVGLLLNNNVGHVT